MAAEIDQFVNFGMAEDKKNLDPSSILSPIEDGELDLMDEVVLDDAIRPRSGQQSVFDLPSNFNTRTGLFEPKQIFLTGATGFLGAFILYDLLRTFPKATLHCLVRGKTQSDGWDRLENNMNIHQLWKSCYLSAEDVADMKNRTKVVLGDLSLPLLGISREDFDTLSNSVECVVHNGALVHWVYPYAKMRPANVNGTIEALRMCVMGKYLKPLHFVSSTSVLDTPYYTEQKFDSVMESDDLEGSRRGLKSGYGQSKWVSEKILALASKRTAADESTGRIPVTVIRPGYILGDSRTGVTNTDDFIWRLIKGCLDLNQVPVMTNVVNAVPVDYCAKIISCVVQKGVNACQRFLFHVWNPQRVRFFDIWESMIQFGGGAVGQEGDWKLEFKPYLEWRDALSERTLKTDDHVLYPLLHFVLDDLPTSTKSPALDWRNTKWALDGSGVKCMNLVARKHDNKKKTASNNSSPSRNLVAQMSSTSVVGSENGWSDDESIGESGVALMERYFVYLCQVGFLPWPPGKKPKEGSVSEAVLISRSKN